MNLMNSYIPLLIIASQRSSVGRILESDISVKRAVGYEYPTYSFQTNYQITVRTVYKEPSFPRRREFGI